ncbi:hypothetical protein D3C83_110190 [compost metagenome]
MKIGALMLPTKLIGEASYSSCLSVSGSPISNFITSFCGSQYLGIDENSSGMSTTPT